MHQTQLRTDQLEAALLKAKRLANDRPSKPPTTPGSDISLDTITKPIPTSPPRPPSPPPRPPPRPRSYEGWGRPFAEDFRKDPEGVDAALEDSSEAIFLDLVRQGHRIRRPEPDLPNARVKAIRKHIEKNKHDSALEQAWLDALRDLGRGASAPKMLRKELRDPSWTYERHAEQTAGETMQGRTL